MHVRNVYNVCEVYLKHQLTLTLILALTLALTLTLTLTRYVQQHIATAEAARSNTDPNTYPNPTPAPGGGEGGGERPSPRCTLLSRRRVRGRGARGQRLEFWRVEDSGGRGGDGSGCHDGAA